MVVVVGVGCLVIVIGVEGCGGHGWDRRLWVVVGVVDVVLVFRVMVVVVVA